MDAEHAHAISGGLTALGGARGCGRYPPPLSISPPALGFFLLPALPPGRGIASSGGSASAGHHARFASSRQNDAVPPDAATSSTVASSGGSPESPPPPPPPGSFARALVRSASALRYSRSARPLATASAPDPSATALAAASAPSAPSVDLAPPSDFKSARRSPASNGGAGKCSFGSRSDPKGTVGSKRSRGRRKAPPRVGTHACDASASPSAFRSAAPVHASRAARSFPNAASSADGASDPASSPLASAGRTCAAKNVAASARGTRQCFVSTSASSSESSERNEDVNSRDGASSGATSGDGVASKETNDAAAADARGSDARCSDARVASLTGSHRSNTGRDRNRSSLAPTNAFWVPFWNHRRCVRKARSALRAGASGPRVSKPSGTRRAAARHLASAETGARAPPPFVPSSSRSSSGGTRRLAAATAESSVPAAVAGRAYLCESGCAAAAAPAGSSAASRRTPSASSALDALSDHPSPRTTAPCGVSGASAAPSSTGRSGAPSNGAISSGVGASVASRRHSVASCADEGCSSSVDFSGVAIPSRGGHQRSIASPRRVVDHARGIALGKKSAASAAASTARTPSARPAAPRASASILSRRPGTVASANRSTSDPEAPGSDARSLASSSSVER